jgi:hypothetical protein
MGSQAWVRMGSQPGMSCAVCGMAALWRGWSKSDQKCSKKLSKVVKSGKKWSKSTLAVGVGLEGGDVVGGQGPGAAGHVPVPSVLQRVLRVKLAQAKRQSIYGDALSWRLAQLVYAAGPAGVSRMGSGGAGAGLQLVHLDARHELHLPGGRHAPRAAARQVKQRARLRQRARPVRQRARLKQPKATGRACAANAVRLQDNKGLRGPRRQVPPGGALPAAARSRAGEGSRAPRGRLEQRRGAAAPQRGRQARDRKGPGAESPKR